MYNLPKFTYAESLDSGMASDNVGLFGLRQF